MIGSYVLFTKYVSRTTFVLERMRGKPGQQWSHGMLQ